MSDLPMLLPSINLMGLPEEEYELARLLSNNLTTLLHHVGLFETALKLADFCDETRTPYRAKTLERVEGDYGGFARAAHLNRQFIEWKQLAARDGAITLYNFAETKQVLDKQKAHCPTIFPHIDRNALKRANVLFDKEFPGYADIRLSVAHSGTLSKSEQESLLHRVPGTKLQIMQMLTDRRLASSINGKMVHYDLTAASLTALEAVTAEIYRAYEPAAKFTFTLPRQAFWEERIRQWREETGKTGEAESLP